MSRLPTWLLWTIVILIGGGFTIFLIGAMIITWPKSASLLFGLGVGALILVCVAASKELMDR